MKLSNTVGHFVGRFGWERTADLMQAAGYDALDANFCDMHNDSFQGGQWASDRYIDRAHELREYLDRKGFACNQLHVPFSLPEKLWAEQLDEVCIPLVKRAMEIGSILGADVCVVHPLHHMYYMGNEEKLFEMNMDYYSRLGEFAKKIGVRVGVENMWQRDQKRGCICHDTCSTSEEYIRYIDTLNDPAIVACLDVGHVELIQRTDTTADVIRALGGRIAALHVHDNGYRADDHTLPYHGRMDWSSICEALGSIDYKGDLTFEVGGNFFGRVPDALMPSALKYSADVGRQLISLIDAARPERS